jgi:hypothetical protein
MRWSPRSWNVATVANTLSNCLVSLSFSSTIFEAISFKDVVFLIVHLRIYSSWRPGSLYQRRCIIRVSLSRFQRALDYSYPLVFILVVLRVRPPKYIAARYYLYLLGRDANENKWNNGHSAELHGRFWNQEMIMGCWRFFWMWPLHHRDHEERCFPLSSVISGSPNS